jgi:hypothetical protein
MEHDFIFPTDYSYINFHHCKKLQFIDRNQIKVSCMWSLWIICTDTASKPSEESFSTDELMIMAAWLTACLRVSILSRIPCEFIDCDQIKVSCMWYLWITCTDTASKPSEESFSTDEIMIMAAWLTPSPSKLVYQSTEIFMSALYLSLLNIYYCLQNIFSIFTAGSLKNLWLSG